MIFLDTSFLFALFVEGDADHVRVRASFKPYVGRRKLKDQILTTSHVVAETITLIRKRGHPDPRARHQLAGAVGAQLLNQALARVHRASEDEEQEALAYFLRHPDQDYSFTDCA